MQVAARAARAESGELKVREVAGLPYIGVGLKLLRDLPSAIIELGRGYDVVATRLLGTPTYIIVGVDAIREVLVTQAKHAARLGKFQRAFRYFGKQAVLGDGVLGAEPGEWLWQRRGLSPRFSRERMTPYEGEIRRIAGEVTAEWGSGEVRSLLPYLQQITARVILRVVFAEDDSGLVARARRTFNATTLQTGKRGVSLALPASLPTPANRSLKATLRELDELIYQQIDRYDPAAGGDSVLGHIKGLAAGDGKWSQQIVRDNIAGLIVAGYETTSAAIAWACHFLALNPLWQELAAGDPTVAEASFKEALRLRPVAPMISREVTEDFQLGGRWLRVGDQLLISPLVNHRDERYFRGAAQFDPGRWMEGAEAAAGTAYMPFGMGGHMCLGKYLAELEGRVVLHTILQRFSLRPLSPQLPAGRFSGSLRPVHSRFIVERR